MGPGAGAGPPSKPMPAAGGDDSSDDEPLGARLKKGGRWRCWPGLSLTLQGGERLCYGAGPPPKAAKPAAKAAPKVRPKLCATSPRSPGRTQAQAHIPAQAGKQDAAEGAPAARGAGKAEKAGKAPKRVKKEDGEPVVKRERKVYDMPGQTKATPDEARACCPPATG
jgi:hypothetical protein